MNLSSLKDWIPYQLIIKENSATCKWLYLNDKKFTEPFFDETISICKYAEENRSNNAFVSDIDVLPQWFNKAESVEPSIIIFHVSRCGSTLATQLFALNEKNIILSEVPFFDALLRWRNLMPNPQEEKTLQLLKTAIACYAQKRSGNENRLIIKTDSWHVFFINN